MSTANNGEFGTIIGADAKFKGELEFESAAKVLGSIEGSISSKGSVHIADGSTCKATVHAKEVSVEGLIEGNVQAIDKLDVRPNGRIAGDCVAARMSMAEGASIEGFMRIGKNNGPAKAIGQTEVKPEAKPVVQATAKK